MTDHKTTITVSIPVKLLTKVIEDIEGKTRSQKLEKCISKGYQILNGE